jgi:transposase
MQFSKKYSEKRILKACKLIGRKTVNRIIALALYFLGANREQISKFLKLPIGTFFSLLTRFQHNGIEAIVDKREKKGKKSDGIGETELITEIPPGIEIIFGEKNKVINIPVGKNKIIVNSSNLLQFKTLVLSFMSSGFLTTKETSDLLDISQRHVINLSKNIESDDINPLIDKRQGQQKDYVFTEDIKSELIQQYTANIVTGRSTSSSKITEQVNQAGNIEVSERAVRHHVSKLGLNRIRYSLPKLLKRIKKNSEAY